MKSLSIVVLMALFASGAHAQHETFVVNPDASTIEMTLNATHEVVHGSFHVQSGSVGFDVDAGRMSGTVIVLAGSGRTGNGSRDKRMSKEILRAEQYATVSFEPKSYAGVLAPSEDSTLQVSGIFTLLGTPHKVTIPVSVHLDAAGATAKAHFVVPYIQWGLKDPSFLVWKADKVVAIDLLLSGIRNSHAAFEKKSNGFRGIQPAAPAALKNYSSIADLSELRMHAAR